jgi:hypothetical protein
MHLHNPQKNSATYLFHISKHIFLSVQVSGLRSAVIVIASAGHDNAHSHKQYNFFYLVRHVLIGVDHGKLDRSRTVQGIEW